jgi:hypothetical protein
MVFDPGRITGYSEATLPNVERSARLRPRARGYRKAFWGHPLRTDSLEALGVKGLALKDRQFAGMRVP